MDFRQERNESSDEQQATSNSHKAKKNRHSAHQIQQLEEFFKEYPNPDENQRTLLSIQLHLDPMQIKFWFQNKRTQAKAQNQKAVNDAIKEDIDELRAVNLSIKEALKAVKCTKCDGPNIGEEERQLSIQRLQIENIHLQEQFRQLSGIVSDSVQIHAA